MQVIKNWEKNSTVRNRPRRLLINDGSKYFFPITEQPLCLHPLIDSLGEETKHYVLVQSAYVFMQNIFINETEVVSKIARKIIQGKTQISFPEEMYQNLLTVIIDETYHAYVANDFIHQVSNATKMKPIGFSEESSLTRAIHLIKNTLPPHCRFLFEIIAVCIAENSITKELIVTIKDPEVNSFFNEINIDHLADEGRHCGIFFELLAHLWKEMTEDIKKKVGPSLPNFICEYLNREVKIKSDRKILSQLPLMHDEMETILYDTHPDYTVETLRLINPIVDNVVGMLQRAGILSHPETAIAFQRLGYIENTNILQNTQIQQAENHWQLTLEHLNAWQMDFLRSIEHSSFPEQQLHHSVLLNVDIVPNICCGFLISYLHDVTQHEQISFRLIASISSNKIISVPVLSTLDDVATFFDFTRQIDTNIVNSIALSSSFEKIALQKGCLNEGENWFHKIPLCVTLSEEFVLEQNHSEMLQVHIFPSDRNSLQISVYYSSKYYDLRRIAEFLENFSYYLTTALKQASSHRKNIPLVSPKQRELLLKHAGAAPYINDTQDETIITLFAKQVAENPMQLAIVDEFITITYQELHFLSDIVSHKLQNLGLKSGAIIAVIHEHTYVYIPIILGIMKAKMVFLPLSPNEASVRLHAILQEAQVSLVVSDLEQPACGQGEFFWISSSTLIEQSGIKIENNRSKLAPDDLAYLIYTSGSSGVPKGVMITHGSLIHFARSAAKTFPITKHDRVLQFCAYNFDASLADICASFISGATICLRTKNLLDSSSCFFSVCQRYKITLLNLPATLWGQLVQDIFAFSLELPDSLKTVVIGGEALAPAILAQWFQHKRSDIRLLNTYGPTETTIAVTACELNAYALFYSREKLIGKSFTRALLYVLDPYHRLLPIGASGELYIGGPGVGRGYFKRPDLTEKSFLNHLNQINSDLPSGTIYKTGDKVRWANKETLEFIGRVDRQIKIRGFRVELVEIEHVLNAHPLVVSSLVIYYDKTDYPYLAAFMIPKCLIPKSFNKVTNITSELNNTMASIKSHLQLHLPEHMQVNHIQFVEKWPITTQGKIDTIQLIAMLSIDKKHHQLTDDMDSRLATLWKNLLGIQEIDADSHFFHLGGHSLIAMHLLAHISREFQAQLTLRDILETPNFRNMVTLIKHRFGKKNSDIQVQSGSISGPLSFAQEGLWVIDYLQSGNSINYNIAFALHLKGTIDPIILERALNHIIERQWILRSVFKNESSVIQQTVTQMNIVLRSEIITLDKFKEEALVDARTPFHLSNKPPLRLRLFQINSEYCILFVNHHHIIHDGYSINIFVKELSHCYEALCACELPRLPELSRQYTDYAQWQRSVDNECATRSLDYWCQQLKDYKPLCLPFRKTNVMMNSSSGNTYHFSIDHTLTQQLRTLCSNQDCTLFVGLLAMMIVLFQRYSGEKDIAFASVMSTRDHQIDEYLMGMFLNVVILRNRINPENSFFELLAHVKKTLLEATSHRFTPLEFINKSMNLQRLPFCHTLVDICVSYHHFEQSFAKFESKTINSEVEFIDNKTAKFGLSFDIYDNKKSLLIKIEYCTELYNLSSIEKFAQDYLILTKSVAGVHL